MIESVGAEAAEELAVLHASAFAKPWSAAEIARLLENPTAFALIERQQAPRGFIMAWAVAADSEVLTLAVAPEARRQGVGAGLVSAAGAAALVRGAGGMHLEVAEDNAAARALYVKLGFSESGRRPGYYAEGGANKDAIVLSRALPRPQI